MYENERPVVVNNINIRSGEYINSGKQEFEEIALSPSYLSLTITIYSQSVAIQSSHAVMKHDSES